MRLVLLSNDLMLASAAQGPADRHGFELVTVPDVAAATAACGDETARLLAVDLRTPALDIEKLVADLRQSGAAAVRVLACGPHVHEQSLARAVAAGCDEVVTRGEFERRLDAALARLASPAG
jgi:DNA-binding response OmpR family regulator